MAKRAFSDFIGFSRASAAWRFNSSGVLVQEAANVPRDDYDPISGLWNGLLIEESRTNGIRNNSMVGAVNGTAGAGGVWPTNWSRGIAGSPNTDIVGTGVDSGIPYMDVRIYGSASGNIWLYIDGPSTAVAASGQTWAASTYLRLMAGSLANVSQANIQIEERDSGGVFLSSGFANIATVSGATLSGQRFAHIRQLASAATAKVGTVLFFTLGAAPYDLTLRIGAPQLELGAFPTSPILTTNAQVTRAADTVAVGSLPPWFNPSEGTLYAEVVMPNPAGSSAIGIVSLDDGSDSNRLTISKELNGKAGFAAVAGGSATAIMISANAVPVGAVARLAAAYKAADFALSINGEPAVTAASGAVPSNLGAMRIGRRSNPALSYVNGWLRAVKYNPRRMTNAELQAMTTLPNANGPTLAFDFKAKTFNLEHI